MMTSSNFEVRTQVPNTTTRPNGAAAREKLRSALLGSDSVVVDMTDIILTPSFADEFLGVLLAELGEDNFRRAIKIVNVSETSRPLLQTVLHRRASNPRPPQPPLHVSHA